VFEKSVAFFCKPLRRIEILVSAERIKGFDFCDCLTEVIFESESRIRDINGFSTCEPLEEIKIPASVEILRGFNKWLKLKSVMSASNCCLREIVGFNCCLIDSIEIPASVKFLKGFGGRPLSHLLFAEGTLIKIIDVANISWQLERRRPRVFIAYDETDLRKGRGRLDVLSRWASVK
jgi:hypothetical protein